MPIYYILYCILYVPEQPKCPKWNLGWTHKSSTHTHTDTPTFTYMIFGEAVLEVWLLVNHISIQLYLIQPHWSLSEEEFVKISGQHTIQLKTCQCVKDIDWNVRHHNNPKTYQLESKTWPCSCRCNESGLTEPTVICLEIVTRFGNCTNVWLWTNAKCCCFFFCVYHDIFIKNKSMLKWPFAL